MRLRAVQIALALCALLALPATAHAADSPSSRTLYEDGPSGRFLLDGAWYTRADPGDRGIKAGLYKSPGLDGWLPTEIPNAANAGDFSARSYVGSVQWYRRDFFVPSAEARSRWILRFESVNYRATVYLNGKRIGRHTGAYLPFEVPADSIKRHGANRLVIRVDSRHGKLDVPNLVQRSSGHFTGGWWNYTGILREVYLRGVDRLDLRNVFVRPQLRCPTCSAVVSVEGIVHNVSRTRQEVSAEATVGGHELSFEPVSVAPGKARRIRASLRLEDPHLWSTTDPYLYPVKITLRNTAGSVAQHYTVHTGVRSLEVEDGHMLLNGKRVDFRGASMHEDDPTRGAALTPDDIESNFELLGDLGATMTRSHYPMHPLALELADRKGIVVWSEIPVYQMQDSLFRARHVRSLSLRMAREMVLRDRNHPSVIVWSLGNENTSRPGIGFRRYIRQARRAVKRLDPTRLIGLAFPGYPNTGKISLYKSFDALGVNSYFGWYPGPGGTVEDRAGLGPYLDQLHDDYPKQAIFVTEFGAEANHSGPLDQKGTYEFQSDLLAYHLSVYATRPWLNGALVWILRDFRVKPDYDGGNPTPDPPLNEKGLVDDKGDRKPSFQIVQQAIRRLQAADGQ